MRYGLEDVAFVEEMRMPSEGEGNVRGLGMRGIPAGDFAEQDWGQESTREPESRARLQVYLSHLFDANNRRCRSLLGNLGLSALLFGVGALIGNAGENGLQYLAIPADFVGAVTFVNHFRFY